MLVGGGKAALLRHRWEGFHLRSLMEIVDPLTEAKWLHFYCADNYYESLSLEELLMERVRLCRNSGTLSTA